MDTLKNIPRKIKKFIKNIFVFPVSARRQFHRLLVVFFLALVAVIAFHTRFFYQVESESYFQSNTDSTALLQMVNEKKLTDILSRFDAKEKARADISNSTPPVLEPSR